MNVWLHGTTDSPELEAEPCFEEVVMLSLCCHFLYRENKGVTLSTQEIRPLLGPRGVTE